MFNVIDQLPECNEYISNFTGNKVSSQILSVIFRFYCKNYGGVKYRISVATLIHKRYLRFVINQIYA